MIAVIYKHDGCILEMIKDVEWVHINTNTMELHNKFDKVIASVPASMLVILKDESCFEIRDENVCTGGPNYTKTVLVDLAGPETRTEAHDL